MKTAALPDKTKPPVSRNAKEMRALLDRFQALAGHLIEHGHGGKIVLPLPPNMANARLHWRVKHKLRETVLSHCAALLRMGLIPPPPKEPPEHAEMSVTMYVASEHDDDNAIARYKFCQDFLVRQGYLKDDKKKNLTTLGLPKQVVSRQHVCRIEFEIKEKL